MQPSSIEGNERAGRAWLMPYAPSGAGLRDPATGFTTMWEHGKALSHEGASITILAARADPAPECPGLVVVVAAQALPPGTARGGQAVTALAAEIVANSAGTNRIVKRLISDRFEGSRNAALLNEREMPHGRSDDMAERMRRGGR